jgi:ubiquinone/menaquinone biosynthesis C-methylase UbiE
MTLDSNQKDELDEIQAFYDTEYYRAIGADASSENRHYRALASRLEIAPGRRVLDVACGTGAWLKCCASRGAAISGVDLSRRAIEFCKSAHSSGAFHACAAEQLPFDDLSFDLVTCLGSLEHFVDPVAALHEMRRVAVDGARFVILVPNADFMTRRLGLFKGTYQTQAKEQVRTLAAWQALFAEAGLVVEARWKDLHVLSRDWIVRRPWLLVPVRAAQALSLVLWPLSWQYQVYFLCSEGPHKL